MKLKRRMLALAMSGLMLTGTLAGCGGGDGKEPAASGGSQPVASSPADGGDAYEITTICMALNSDYWHMVEAGAKLAGKELGVKVNVIGPNAESDLSLIHI